MRNSFALVILAALLSLSGCESVSQVPVNLEPKSVSETAMLMPVEPESSSEPVTTMATMFLQKPREPSIKARKPIANTVRKDAFKRMRSE